MPTINKDDESCDLTLSNNPGTKILTYIACFFNRLTFLGFVWILLILKNIRGYFNCSNHLSQKSALKLKKYFVLPQMDIILTIKAFTSFDPNHFLKLNELNNKQNVK